ncbi:MAG TPA: TULIP family P47-like protein [Aquabacterium sp.]|nr:TULIP family P47-like protein [Quisquiliibacterium sp.]HQC96606.1 TULIP family P47-like protein [Aquabacterium sp.]
MPAPQTYGWDMVIAVRTGVLNRRFTAAGGAFSASISHANGSVAVEGSLGAWQIATGGSGALLKFAIPCARLKLTQASKSVAFSDGSFLVEAQLAFAEPASAGGARPLRIVPGKDAVSAQAAEFDDPAFPGFAAMAVAGLQQWLDVQAAFPYIFGTFAGAPTGGAEPVGDLVPPAASYAYADAADGNGGVLAVLCGAEPGAGSPHLLQEVDPAALGGGDAVALVGEAVLARVLALGLSQATLPGGQTLSATVAAALSVPLTLKGGA